MALHHMLRAAAGNAGPSDPYFEYNTLLLTGDGTNGAQNNTFLDSSTNNFTITRNGNTTQGSFSPYGNLWSNYFDGSGDSISQTTGNFSASGNLTLEGWVYATNTNQIAFSIGNESAGRMQFGLTGNGAFYYNISGGSVINFGGVLPLNSWNHFAFVRSGTTVTAYLNGASVGSQTISGTIGNANGIYVWGFSSGSSTNVGYLSNVRYVNGTAVYTSNFTPSTTPLTAVSGTSLLTCQSNRFIDNSSNNFTLTVNGNTSVQRFSPFNPTAAYSAATIGGSGYFDGTGDYLQAPSNAAFNFGTGEFTVEAWVYLNTLNTDKSIIDFRSTTNSFGAFYISGSGNVLGFYDGSVTASGTALVAGAWYHIAYVRTGTTLYAYLNGVQQWTRALSTNITSTGAPEIGADFGGSASLMNGYISNLRVVKGTAVYTSNFTPPTAPLTAITNTSLLTNFTNAGIPDAAMMNDLETVGNAQVSTSVKKYGTGSLAFDGTGDYLKSSDTLVNQLGGGNFTLEAWVYPTASPNPGGIIGKQSGSVIYGEYAFYQAGTAIGFSASSNSSSWNIVSISGGTLSLNAWSHVAVTRNGSTFTLWLNGTSVATGTSSTAIAATTYGALSVGSLFDNGNFPFNGYIDDLRITKGLARYTANFTPPTAALPTY